MTERTSWRCVGCGCVHAPHVDTCPIQHVSDVVVSGVPDFPMTPDTTKVERRLKTDAELLELAEIMPNLAAAKRAGDHAAPTPSPLRYREMMGDIDA